MRVLGSIIALVIGCFLLITPLMAQWQLDFTIDNGGFESAVGGGSIYFNQGNTAFQYSESGDSQGSTTYPAIEAISYNSGLYVSDGLDLVDIFHETSGWMYEVRPTFIDKLNPDGDYIHFYGYFTSVKEGDVCPVTGNVALADFGAGEIVILDNVLDGIIMTIPFSDIRVVAFDEDGNLLAGSTSQVKEYQAGGYNEITSFSLSGDSPESMVFGNNGKLFIIKSTETSVYSKATVPTILESFSVNELWSNHQLNWFALTEVNFDYYAIEHSLDGISFRQIGRIDGRGSNSSYQFLFSPQEGNNYYRLKQVDLDGRYDYSKIVSLRHNKEERTRVFPNPSTGLITLSQPATIYDELSKYVTKTSSTSEKVYLKQKGIYWVRFENGRVEKLIIVK